MTKFVAILLTCVVCLAVPGAASAENPNLVVYHGSSSISLLARSSINSAA